MAENDEVKSRIKQLNETLYSRTRYRDSSDKRIPIKGSDLPEVKEEWPSPKLDEILGHEQISVRRDSLIKKFFFFSLIFFIIAIGVAAYVFFGGVNFVSSKNVNINILGPSNISAGEILEIGVTVSNANNADLEFARLSVQYPQGSRDPNNTSKAITYTREDLGVIKAGSEVVRNIQVVLLGPIGEAKELKFSIEYKVKGSNATFYKDKVFTVVIGSSPVTLTVENPSSVISGESFVTNVTVAMNAPEVLKNAVLKVEYPHGFTAIGSSPEAAINDNVWILGDLVPGSKKNISIRGRLIGENNEERTFRFYVGVSDSFDDGDMKVAIVSLLDTVTIDKSPLNLSLLLNGENAPVYVAPAGRTVSAIVRYKNNLPDKLLNLHLEVSLVGTSLDKRSVSVSNNGFYDSANSRIIWNLTNIGGISELAPGDSGQVNFAFASLPEPPFSLGRAGDISLTAKITGTPIGSDRNKTVSANVNRVVKISSEVNLSSKALYSIGPFSNRGPIPPKAETETTYTIIFSVGNTRGDLSEALVTATLGQGVNWTGAVNAEGENIYYDESSGVITWNLGTLTSETGFSSAAREVAFQVSLVPSITQIGTAPVLVTNIMFTGRDSVSGNTITTNVSPLTTRLVDDPAFVQGDDLVTR